MSSILVVEDHHSSRNLLVKLLRLEGYRAIPAANVWQALAVLETEKMDLILLDFDLPGINGDGLLAELRTDPRFRNIPVIMVTAQPMNPQVWDEHRQNLRDWLVKGEYSPQQLLTSVEENLLPTCAAPHARTAT
jgi:CheY-like chemotaxis protein